jgi:hypothetical protein
LYTVHKACGATSPRITLEGEVAVEMKTKNPKTVGTRDGLDKQKVRSVGCKCWRAGDIEGWRGERLQAVYLVPEYVVGHRLKVQYGPLHSG